MLSYLQHTSPKYWSEIIFHIPVVTSVEITYKTSGGSKILGEGIQIWTSVGEGGSAGISPPPKRLLKIKYEMFASGEILK